MQFSLKTLFIVVTVIALLCAIAFALPVAISAVALSLAINLTPPILTACAVFMRRNVQAFCVGAAPTTLLVTVAVHMNRDLFAPNLDSGDPSDALNARNSLAVVWLAIAFSGLLGIGMRVLSLLIYPTNSPPRTSASSAVPPSTD